MRYKKGKRWLAVLVDCLLIANLFLSNGLISGLVARADGAVWAPGAISYGDVTLDKKVLAERYTDTERIYDIMLSATGKQYSITEGSRPIYATIVLNLSDSTAKNNNGVSYAPLVVQAANDFANRIFDANSENHVALVYYDKVSTQRQEFTNNKNTMKNKIAGVKFNGSSNMEAGLLAAYDMYINRVIPSNAVNVIVYLTDGVPNYCNSTTCKHAAGQYPTSEEWGGISCGTRVMNLAQDIHESGVVDIMTIGVFEYLDRTYPASSDYARQVMDAIQNRGLFIAPTDVEMIDAFYQITERIVSSASDVIITDTIPKGFRYVADSASPKLSSPAVVNADGTTTLTWKVAALDTAAMDFTYQISVNDGFFGGSPYDNGVDGGLKVPTQTGAAMSYTDKDNKKVTGCKFPEPNVDLLRPKLAISKNAAKDQYKPGETAQYRIVVTNNGPFDLKGITLTDVFTNLWPGAEQPLLAQGDATFDLPANKGAASSKTITVLLPIALDGVTTDGDRTVANRATAAGGKYGAQLTVTDTASIDIQEPTAKLELIKTITKVNDKGYAAGSRVNPGDVIEFSILVKNTGTVDLTNIVVTDPLLGANWPKTIQSLAAGASSPVFTDTYIVPESVEGSSSVNNRAEAKTIYNNKPVTAVDNAAALVMDKPALHVVKTSDKAVTGVLPGETVNFEIKVTNTGNCKLNDLKLTDAFTYNKVPASLSGFTLDGAAFNPDDTFSLEVGKTATIRASYPVAMTEYRRVDMSNKATVSNSLVSDASEVTVEVKANPVLKVTKSVDKTSCVAGDTLVYTITVTNDGNCNLMDIAMADSLTIDGANPQNLKLFADSLHGSQIASDYIFDLEKGASRVFMASFTVPDMAQAGVQYLNTATASYAGGSISAAALSTVQPVSGVSIVKKAQFTTAQPGQTVQYTITVKNEGNSAIIIANLIDKIKLGSDDAVALDLYDRYSSPQDNAKYDGAAFELAAYQSRGFVVVYTVPSNLTADTKLTNTATLTTGGKDYSDYVENMISVRPDLSVTKVTDKARDQYKPGDTVNYTITVSNTGNCDLTGIVLTDVINVTPQLQLQINNISGGGLYDGSPFNLAVGESRVFTAKMIIPQQTPAGTDYLNTATATIQTLNIEKKAIAEVIVADDPAYTVEKTASASVINPGQNVVYTITVSNTGNCTLEGLTLSDVFQIDNQGTALTIYKDLDANEYVQGTAFTLGRGEKAVFTASYMVASNQTKDQKLVNTASVAYKGGSKSAQATVDVVANPKLAITKTITSAGEIKPGDTVYYEITVSNAGKCDLTGIRVADVMNIGGDASGLQLQLKDAKGTVYTVNDTFDLNKNGSKSFTAQLVVPNNASAGVRYANTATASCPDAETVQDQASFDVAAVPNFTVVKTAAKAVIEPGEAAKYTITVANTGNCDLIGLTIADVFTVTNANQSAQVTPLSIYLGTSATPFNTTSGTFDIARGQSVTFTAEYPVSVLQNMDQDLRNTVTVTHPASGLSKDSNAEVKLQSITNFVVQKTLAEGSSSTPKPGDTVQYAIAVMNNGNYNLTDLTLEDVLSIAAPAQSDPIFETAQEQLQIRYKSDSSLYHGEKFDLQRQSYIEFTATLVIPAGTPAGTIYRNTATSNNDNTTDTGVQDVIVQPVPGLTAEKVADKAQINPGETVNYTIAVANTGNTTLYNIKLEDIFKVGGVQQEIILYRDGAAFDLENNTFTLLQGESAIFTASYTAPSTTHANTPLTNDIIVTAEGIAPVESGANSEIVARPSLTVDKVADKANAKPGETVHYTITVTNTGNCDLMDVTLADEMSLSGIATTRQLAIQGYEGAFNLKAGEKKEFAASFTVPADARGDTQYVNVALAGNAIVQAQGEASFTVGRITGLDISKSADKANAAPGETVLYTITVTNTGNIALDDIRLHDVFTLNGQAQALDLLGDGVPFDPASETFSLDMGKTILFTASYLVPTDITQRAELVNQAGVEQGEFDIQTEDTAKTIIDPNPELSVEKTVDIEYPIPGETLLYTIMVKNTGDCDLTGIALEDIMSINGQEVADQPQIIGYNGAFDLAIGQSMTFSAQYTVKQDAAYDDQYQNLAVATVLDITVSDLVTSAVFNESGENEVPTGPAKPTPNAPDRNKQDELIKDPDPTPPTDGLTKTGETISMAVIIGAVMMLAGILLVILRRKGEDREEAEQS